MKTHELEKLGLAEATLKQLTIEVLRNRARDGISIESTRSELEKVAKEPLSFENDPYWGALASRLGKMQHFTPREKPAPWSQWGPPADALSLEQMKHASQLPVAVSGALMPDVHPGYGLPIGGVLATDNAVIPFAVGVDIACRMKLTILDIPVSALDDDQERDRLISALNKETAFGVGARFNGEKRREHSVLDADWSVSSVTKRLKDKAWEQLGTSGSGNHFVEYGELRIEDPAMGIEAGTYLALLSHSGSRGTGAAVAEHYSKLAKEQHPELPVELRRLAWLDMDTGPGQEYWAAMNLMGEYASANHACIHSHIARNLGSQILFSVENHHNFAWKETHSGKELYVHRKGATPAAEGVLGVIPGSMASPAFIVRGKGQPDSLNSASHGAGRVMSRKKAREVLDWKTANALLRERRVTLLSAGLDEVPMVYKDIEQVMAAQTDLVEQLARFQPRIVKMAPVGERPED